MARAVIELSSDISPAMPRMSTAIKGCVYSPQAQMAAFRFDNMRVIVERSQITIYGAEDEFTARRVIRWLISKIYDSDKK